MTQLLKEVEEGGARAKSDNRITGGRVIHIDTTTRTVLLDVSAFDAQGNPIYQHGIGYQAQTPPQLNDLHTVLYSNISPHSGTISSSSVGGANTGSVVEVAGAVSGLRVVGETAFQQGNLEIEGTGGISITRIGKRFTVNSGATGGLTARKNSTGTTTARRSRLNLIEGANVTITLGDDSTNDEIDVTIASTASSSSTGSGIWNTRGVGGAGSGSANVSSSDTAVTYAGNNIAYTANLPIAGTLPNGTIFALSNIGTGSTSVDVGPGLMTLGIGQGCILVVGGAFYAVMARPAPLSYGPDRVLLSIPPVTWTVPTTTTELHNTSAYRAAIDLSRVGLVRISAALLNNPVGGTLTMQAQSGDGTTWANLGDAITLTGGYLPPFNVFTSAWSAVGASTSDNLVRIVASHSTGTSIQFGTVELQARSS